MRCQDPAITREQLDAFIAQYQESFADLTHYADHLAWWIARYSRGDPLDELSRAFATVVVGKVAATDEIMRSRRGGKKVFTHEGRYAGLFRDELVLVSLALCLRVPRGAERRLLACCEDGDPLFETVARAAEGKAGGPAGAPAFPTFFDGLYAAVAADPAERPRLVADYLRVWRSERMADFGFILAHAGIGYWCFEAAGVVAALRIDDRTFADHPHYPRDLVAFAREARRRTRKT